MSDKKTKIRCPYCTKIFIVPTNSLNFSDGVTARNMRCPYCKEQVVLRKDMQTSRA